MLFAIISAVLAYRKAKDTGRNGFLWAFIAAATFIGTQLVVALIFGILLGLILAFMQKTEEDFDKFQIYSHDFGGHHKFWNNMAGFEIFRQSSAGGQLYNAAAAA